MGASVKTLSTVSSVEEERFVLLYLRELVPQTFNLPTLFRPGPSDVSRLLASGGATSGGRVAILDKTLVDLVR